MARPSPRLQLSSRRFLILRMERAFARGDMYDHADSPRAQSVSLMVGAAAAAVVVTLGAVVTTWRPSPSVGDAQIVMVRDNGAVYVRVQDVLHPVLNLTSARLIAGSGDGPRMVSAAALTDRKRGALLGIPGAPQEVGTLMPEPGWTVCDGTATTVIADTLAPPVRWLGDGHALLVAGPSGSTYLLYGGQRARLDVSEPAVAKALRLDGLVPAPVSRALLELVPEVPAITAPHIANIGSPGPAALPGFTVGDVVQVRGAGGTDFYVVLAGGVQPVGQVAAEVIRFGGPGAAVTTVAPASLSGLPTLGVLPVQQFPDRVDTVRGADAGTVCASWHDSDGDGSQVDLSSGDIPLHPSQPPVPLAQADAAGPRVDEVYLPPGRAAYVRADRVGEGTGWLVSDLGIAFRVGDVDTARVLGLPSPATVPRAVLDALPRGPQLSRSAALTAYDVVAPG
ncbi:type VII secretion protein EccB [Mycolicibacterium mengxianglii]|uniref:type VII secretion protein EccB n=1 Tax=Mycolicibacterium mengxianglii TaxID=2736649 RepID=UPI0018D07C32|nr:type VII secretion protein EccB [Mycolicibacterium mengxianglii]